ncbi:hypothetical protein GCM10009610_71810 [Pseudonocardia xinjiangensis]
MVSQVSAIALESTDAVEAPVPTRTYIAAARGARYADLFVPNADTFAWLLTSRASVDGLTCAFMPLCAGK